jgi:hypothetical protein
LASGDKPEISAAIRQILDDCNVTELKWNRLGSAKDRFAALAVIDKVLTLVLDRKLRLDTLIWDIEDSRHNIEGRDDIENLQRMYFHLFEFIIGKKNNQCKWVLMPDENSAINWNVLGDCLRAVSYSNQVSAIAPKRDEFVLNLPRRFWINDIYEVSSKTEPMCQLADLFAGMASFSHCKYSAYESWSSNTCGQMKLPIETVTSDVSLSNRDKERCTVLDAFARKCKKHKLGVSLREARGLPHHYGELLGLRTSTC